MPLGGDKVGTGFVPIKPDTDGFGAELERGLDKEGKPAAKRAGDGLGREASLAMRAAFGAGLAVIGKSVLDFAGFEKGMNEVFTLLPDISGGAMDEMTQQVKDFAVEFAVLPTDVVPALYQSLSAGVPKDNVFAFLEESQKLAKGGVTDLATAVDGLSGVVNAYGEEMGSAGAFSDMMFTTVKLGKTTIGDLSDNLFQVTPIAASLGLGFDQVSASVAALTLVTGNTPAAMTQLKGALAELGKGGSTAFDSFVEATGQTFPDFIKAGGTLGDGLLKMQEFAEANGQTLSDMFGSVEAGQAALVLANGNAEVFTSNLAAMRDSAGATDAAFETMSTGLSATMDRLKARFAVVLLDLGESFAPTIEGVGLALADLLEIFAKLPAPMRSAVLLGGTFLAGILGFAGPILKAVKLLGMMNKALLVLATNPWFVLALVLAGLAYLIITNWSDVEAFFVEFAEVMAEVWHSITATTTEWATATWDTVTGLFDDMLGFVEEWWPLFLGIFTGGLFTLVGLVIQHWDAIKNKTAEVTSAIAGAFAGAWNAVWSTTQDLGGKVLGFITGIPEKIGGAFVTLANIISAPFKTAFDGIKSAWNSTVGGFGFSVPGWIPGVGGNKFNIPRMALGGVASSPMLALIGDAGPRNPEIVTPQNMMRETIAEALGGGSAGITIEAHLHVDGNVDREWFAAQLEGFSVELVRVVNREVDRQRLAQGQPRGALAA